MVDASPATRLDDVRAAITRAAADCGRDASEITLVAVSKTCAADAIRPVLATGHRVFGENYVQEAKAKWTGLREEFSGIELHLVGPLQSNKAGQALQVFDVIQSLDRPSLAEALAREIPKEFARSGRKPRLMVQVNTGEEPQKSGVRPAEVDEFLAACRDRWGLEVEGLMCIPPAEDPP
ncbi:MAG: YggS family pyridoxal phosphate-dependent enzyme, partial [Microvirga sp.]